MKFTPLLLCLARMGEGGSVLKANPELLDLVFRQSEQKVSEDMLSDKMIVKNVYLGRIPDGGNFPLHSGTSIKGTRLGRVGAPNDGGWRKISDGLCATNAHKMEPDIIGHGASEFTYSLIQRELMTPDISLPSLALRADPVRELEHLQMGITTAVRYMREEVRRSRYHDFCDNKMVALAEDAGGGVPVIDTQANDDALLNNGYVFERRADGEMDERYVRVAVDPSNILLISELTMDMLDAATARLAYEGDETLATVPLYDTVLAEQRMMPRLAGQENDAMGGASSNHTAAWDLVDLSQKYGTEGVIRNYSLRHDVNSMRFYPDTVYNAAMIAAGGYAFDLDDPSTWARFVRVFPYKAVRITSNAPTAPGGIKYVLDPSYLRAPFGLSTILSKNVMEVMGFAPTPSVGSATSGDTLGFEGQAKWMNIQDREMNPNKEIGFWLMRMRLAIRPNYTERGYSWFHRINTGLRLRGNTMELPTMASLVDVTPYCRTQLGFTASDAGPNPAID